MASPWDNDEMDEASFKLAMQLMQQDQKQQEEEGQAKLQPLPSSWEVLNQVELDMQMAFQLQQSSMEDEVEQQQPPHFFFPPAATPLPTSPLWGVPRIVPHHPGHGLEGVEASSPFHFNHHHHHHHHHHQPDRSAVQVPPSPSAIKRLIADLKEVFNAKDPTIHVDPDPEDITHIRALIIGPEGTPYEGGFFHFEMRFPHDYPWRPPKVNLETTDGGTVRFNPNLYANGKVCLSILGTWSGPSWTEIQTILSTLLSIQSLMNEKPYHNEPGHEHAKNARDVFDYSECIEHETLRVAIIGMIENPTTTVFMDVMEERFLKDYDRYMSWIEKRKQKDYTPMRDPFGEQRGIFKYSSFIPRLQKLKKAVEERREQARKQKELQNQQKDVEESDDSESDSESDSGEMTKEKNTKYPETEKKDREDEDMAISDTTTTATSVTTVVSEVSSPPNLSEKAGPQIETKPEPIEESMHSLCGTSHPDHIFAMLLQSRFNEVDSPKKESDPPVPTYLPVKPPRLEELKAQSMEEDMSKQGEDRNSTSDASIVCLICKQSPISYIILPSCEQPHIYCYSCAEKRVNRPHHGAYHSFRGHRHGRRSIYSSSITCVLCNAVSEINLPSGLKELKRVRKRKREESLPAGWCLEHKEEMSMYCMDDNQLMCILCAGSTHANHAFEALETAQEKIKPKIQQDLKNLEKQWAKTETLIKDLVEKEVVLNEEAEKKRQESREFIQKLRKILDEKEKELDQSITNALNQRKSSLETQLKRAKASMEKIPGVISVVQSVLDEQSVLPFLQKYEDVEQDARDLCMPTPTPKQDWHMPPANYDTSERMLRFTVKYPGTSPSVLPGHLLEDLPQAFWSSGE